jgi:hypothetical protein
LLELELEPKPGAALEGTEGELHAPSGNPLATLVVVVCEGWRLGAGISNRIWKRTTGSIEQWKIWATISVCTNETRYKNQHLGLWIQRGSFFVFLIFFKKKKKTQTSSSLFKRSVHVWVWLKAANVALVWSGSFQKSSVALDN